ncbi:hypothetical protein, partial [Pseudoalteromonas sp. 20-MNA-CIBAN-0454]|uniref:hypothetical protein n=1 Tax=Pseudoalteromonas sp. 20-MNA-CIBAN-0454 TaxID=3140424 RepID=UPI0033184AEE
MLGANRHAQPVIGDSLIPTLSKTLMPLPFAIITLIPLISIISTSLARTLASFGLVELPSRKSSSG